MIAGTNEPLPASREDLLPASLAARLDRLDVSSSKMFPGALPGERRSKKRGSSVEFDDFRQYVPGDDLRHIDWNVYARMDRLFIKLFREEEDLAVTVLLDSSPSMDAGRPHKLIYAHKLAMALAYTALVANNRVGVVSFGGQTGYTSLPAGRGRRRVGALSEFLLQNLRHGTPEPGAADGSFNLALRRAARERTGKGVFFVLSDGLVREGYLPGLAALANTGHGGFDTTFIQLLSPGELDPAAEGDRLTGDLRLTDIESGLAAEVTVSAELLERYRRRTRAYIEALGSACRSRGMRHALVTTDTPIERLLLQALRRAGVLA
jgi:uncharacterized protein (DUF58 family)